MAKALVGFLENAWSTASEIQIHNDSDKPISLIPFSCHYLEDPRSAFLVRTRLAKTIPAGRSIKVPPKAYNGRDGIPEFQIYMLFRSGDIPQSVEPGEKEKIFLYTDLAVKTEWRLSLDKNQVCEGPGRAADQTSSKANAAGPQDKSLLERLNKLVEELKNKVEDLEKKVKDLEGPLPKKK